MASLKKRPGNLIPSQLPPQSAEAQSNSTSLARPSAKPNTTNFSRIIANMPVLF